MKDFSMRRFYLVRTNRNDGGNENYKEVGGIEYQHDGLVFVHWLNQSKTSSIFKDFPEMERILCGKGALKVVWAD